MTTLFPPLPWEEGATFTNDTTGVGYTYSGGKWLASGGPKVEGEYVSKKGGDEMEGPLKVTNQPGLDSRAGRRIEALGLFSGTESSALRLGTNGDRVYVGSNDTSFNGLVKLDQLEQKGSDGITIKSKADFTLNSGYALTVTRGGDTAASIHSDGTFTTQRTEFNGNHLVTKTYTDNAIKDAVNNIEIPEAPSAKPSLPSYRFAVRNWGSLRPGEISFVDASGGGMSNFDECKGIIFHATDLNGDRAMSYGSNDFTSDLGSALNILSDDGSTLYFRIAEVQKVTGFVKVSFGKNQDSWWFAWDSTECVVKPGGFNQISDGFKLTLQCPDVLF